MEYNTWSLFEEPYWLEAVAPSQWYAVEIRDSHGKLQGRLPYVFSKRFGISMLHPPRLTPWLGPWVRPQHGKKVQDISFQHRVLSNLVKHLPAASYVNIPCAPEFTNLMPFHWAGYQLHVRYTYRLEELKDLENIYAGFHKSVRYECKKASQKVEIIEDDTIDALLFAVEQTFRHKRIDPRAILLTLERIDAVMAPRRQRHVLVARDARGRVHAAVYIVFDERHAFYLAGGGDPQLRFSNAHTLLMWEAIKASARHSKVFDFEGSMIPGVEQFFRGFGGRLVPVFTATRESLPLLMATRYFKPLVSRLANRLGV